MKSKTMIAATVFFSLSVLAACEVQTDDGASEALAAAEAKLAKMATYDAELATIEAWREVWASAEVDKLDALVQSDYKRTGPDYNANNLDEIKAFILQVHATYPDYEISNDGMAAGEDGVFLQWTVTGSDSGRGEASTGNAFKVTGISRYWFADGKIAKELVIFDTGATLAQLETDSLPHTE